MNLLQLAARVFARVGETMIEDYDNDLDPDEGFLDQIRDSLRAAEKAGYKLISGLFEDENSNIYRIMVVDGR